MNEKEIERKLAELLASRGNILPGFTSIGGQLGDQMIVSLDGIRDSVQGIALTSIPPGKIGAVFDKLLSQWYILSNEQPIITRQDKTERQHKEKPKSPETPIRIHKEKEYPKILVLHKNPNLNTKLYEYDIESFNYRLTHEKLNIENISNVIEIKNYYSSNIVSGFDYFENLTDTNEIRETYKVCTTTGGGGSGEVDPENDPRYTCFYGIIENRSSNSTYKKDFRGEWLRTGIVSNYSASPGFRNIGTESFLFNRNCPIGQGAYLDITNNTYDAAFYVSNDVWQCRESGGPDNQPNKFPLDAPNGTILSLSGWSIFTTVAENKSDTLLAPQSWETRCFLTNPNAGEGSGNNGENPNETCIYPEELDSIFNIYKLYFYFAMSGMSSDKKQCNLDIKCRSRTDQEHQVYYSSYIHIKKEPQSLKEVSHYYDIITQKVFKFLPSSEESSIPLSDSYKIIYIDLFYFDETQKQIHNFTILKYYYGFDIPYENDAEFINTAIPWEYKIYNKTLNNQFKYEYKEEEVIRYNENTILNFIDDEFKLILTDITLPSMFEDWQIILENEWRRNISQVYNAVSDNDTIDTQCIRDIRNNNSYTVNITPLPNDNKKKGDINFIDLNQPIPEFQNQPLKDIIFTTNTKIKIKNIHYDYIINNDECNLDETKTKTMIIDNINNLEEGEYSLEGIIYSKNNKLKSTDV